jgi:GNAT superfamily N-acetyltransferase
LNQKISGGQHMEIRLFKPEDAEEVALLVAKTLKISNSKDYSPEYIENNIFSHSAEVLIERAAWGHMYVVCDQAKIVGCGAIAGYWGSTTESILLTIFVLPKYQGHGIGSLIIRTLEQDEYFLRAKRIEIPASITAVEFYRKMGYDYKNGIAELDEEQLYRLEKFR